MRAALERPKPAAERMYDSNKPSAERLTIIAKKLTAIVKREDSTRPVTAALAFPELSNRIGFAQALDVAGYIHEKPRPKFVPSHPDKIERLIPLTEGK